MGSHSAYFRFRQLAAQCCTGCESTTAGCENIQGMGSTDRVKGVGNLETGVPRTGAVAKHFSSSAVPVDMPHVSCSLAKVDRARMAKQERESAACADDASGAF